MESTDKLYLSERHLSLELDELRKRIKCLRKMNLGDTAYTEDKMNKKHMNTIIKELQ